MTRSSRLFALGRMALVLSAGTFLAAQEVNGQITGQVTSGGKAVAGATVEIKAPQLISPRTLTTNEKGEYRAPLLPPGDYTVTVSKDGFLTAQIKAVRLGAGSQLSLPFALKTAEVASTTVVIVGDQGTVDKADPKQSTNFSYDQINALPTAGDRSFTGALDLSPGAAFNSGGGVSIRGGKTQTAQFTINGTNITDDYEGNQTGTYLVDDAVEDVQVVQSPLHARYGRTGSGLINVVTKSGSNDFAGSLRLYLSREDWNALRPHDQDQNASSDSYNDRRREYFLSGPIWKDHIWFAISGYRQPQVSSSNTVLAGETPGAWAYGSFDGAGPGTNAGPYGIPGAGIDPTFNDAVSFFPYDYGKSYQESVTDKFDQGKLTFAITPNHTIEGTYSKRELTDSNRNPYGVPIVPTLQSNSYAQIQEDKFWNIGYRGTLSSNLFVEARYSRKDSTADFPKPPTEHIRLYEYSNYGVMFPYGFNLSPTADERNNRSGNVNVKWFLDTSHGSHEFDFGYDYYESVRQTSGATGTNNQRFYVYGATGDPTALSTYGMTSPDPYGNLVGFLAVNFLDAFPTGEQAPTAGYGLAPTYRKYFAKDGITTNQNNGIYVNDVWSINSHWVMLLGARMDRVKVTDTDGTTLLKTNEPLSPRFSLKYDIFGDSAHVLSFSAAKFVEDISAGYTDAFIQQSGGRYVDYGWTGNAAGKASWVSYAEITNPANYGVAYNYGNTQITNIIGNITNPYVLEYTLGYRRSRANGSFFSVTYIHRDWKNDFAALQDFNPAYFVTVPDPSGSGLPTRFQEGTIYANSSDLKRSYNGVEIAFNEVVNENWTFAGNYTWSRLVGNNNGGDNGGQDFRDNSAAGSAPDYYRSWLLSQGYNESQFAATGPLLSDQTHKLRLYVVRTDKLGIGKITQSLLFRYDSGNNFSLTQTAKTLLPAANGTTVPSGLSKNFTYFTTGRGAFHFNDTYQFDYKLDWYVPIYKTLGLMGYLQVDNVFNHQLQGSYVNGISSASYPAPIKVASTNPLTGFGTDGGNPSSWIGARSFAASIGIRF